MITPQQTEELAEFFQIDSFTIFREYLQLVFLSYFYRQPEANQIYFKGGTAIHLLFGSPRFSEDLDFSTALKPKEIKKILKNTEKNIQKELPGLEILPVWTGKKTIRFRIKYQGADFKYPFTIRLDFALREKPKKILTSPIETKFPLFIFPLVPHLSAEEILMEKIRALLTRSKGRDFFDLWFLLSKEIPINLSLTEKKMAQKKIKNYPLKNLKQDLERFLPAPQRKITGILKEALVEKLEKLI